MNNKQICTQAVHAINNDPNISEYATTPVGKTAMREAVREVARTVESFAERSAADSEAFRVELSADLTELQSGTARISELNAEFESSSVLDEDKLDEYFSLEAQLEALAKKVYDKEARIPAILADLDDPLSALARLERKYPRIQKSYLARFPGQ